MAEIYYSEPELVIGVENKLIFVNPNDVQIFKEVCLPSDLSTAGFDFTEEAVVAEVADTELPAMRKNNQEHVSPSVQLVKYAVEKQMLAVTTNGQKAVLLYECRLEHAKLISARPLNRSASALAFSVSAEVLFVVDKTGDCHEYSCVDMRAKSRLLTGCLSIINDILCTPDSRYLITCDRDDKIRVVNYPHAHEIEGYCLGHTEFVSGIALLDATHLLSVSGDATLRLWNLTCCTELARFDIPAAGVRLRVKRTADQHYVVGVQLYDPTAPVKHSLTFGVLERHGETTTAAWTMSNMCSPGISGDTFSVHNFCFAEDQNVYAIGLVGDEFALRVYDSTGQKVSKPQNWLDMVQHQFANLRLTTEDFLNWFKKSYDNVGEYLQRKKQRMEQQAA